MADFDEFIEGAVYYKEDVVLCLLNWLDREPTECEIAKTLAELDTEDLNKRMADAGLEVIMEAISQVHPEREAYGLFQVRSSF